MPTLTVDARAVRPWRRSTGTEGDAHRCGSAGGMDVGAYARGVRELDRC
uniref:Uncharacterized protein n=1 Tax=Arundo donax TaxID=35708 RepID=A0A0A9CK80_ARUDO